MKSEDIRQNWRRVLDDVRFRDTDVVIERYNEPVGVIVNYDRYQEFTQQQERQGDTALRRRVEMGEQALARVGAGVFDMVDDVDVGFKAMGIG